MNVLGRQSPVVVGHRGGRGEGWPRENTLAAFERAFEQGAAAIETDVRLCADEVVAFHDPTLSRTTGGTDDRAVARVAWAELLATGLDIPRLSDVLDWASARGMAMNVEVKHDVPRRLSLIRAVVGLLRSARVPLVVSSFDPVTLLAVRSMSPRLPCALLTDPKQSYAPLMHAVSRPKLLFGLHVERRQARPADIARWKARGLEVGVWTVNEPEEARRLVAAGVDVVITDQPGRIVEALTAPGYPSE